MLLTLTIYTPTYFIHESKYPKYAELFGDDKRLTQSGREQGIRRLTAINLMKRMESSVYAFNLTLKRIKERNLLSSLMFIFALTDETYPNKDSSKNLQELAEYIESYDFLREHLKMRIDETCERIKKWKRACDSDELKRLQKYIEEIQVLKADLQYFDKLYKNQTSTAKTI